jgi:hypothetical protein
MLEIHCLLICNSLSIPGKETIIIQLNSGPSLSWSYGSWIYNYPCNQCRSPLALWVRTLLRRGVLYTSVTQVTCGRLVVFSGYYHMFLSILYKWFVVITIGHYSFYWYWWHYWTSLFKLSFHNCSKLHIRFDFGEDSCCLFKSYVP